MLSITGIKTHYYKGTSIIQSPADIIQKSKRVKMLVRYTFEGHLIWRDMGWSLIEEGGSRYQVQKSAGNGTRSLECGVVWSPRVTWISINSVSSSAENEMSKMFSNYTGSCIQFGLLWSARLRYLDILYQCNAYPGDIGSSLMGDGGWTRPWCIGLVWLISILIDLTNI